MENHLKIFAERLHLLREEKGLTQQELAELIGIARSTISQYESCLRSPILTIIIKLSNTFNVSIAYLVGESDQR